jgi:hypothetical protein
MATDSSRLRDKTPRLQTDARHRLVHEGEHDAAWGAEIAERLRSVDAGEVTPVPWAEARKRIVREA